MATGDPNPGSAVNLMKLERRNKALELRKAGVTYQQIADLLGYDSHQAWDDVMGEVRRLNKENAETAAEVLTLELERLDTLWQKSWVKLGQLPDANFPALINSMVGIMARRSKLMGLDAPEKKELTGKDGGAVQLQLSDREIISMVKLELATGGLSEEESQKFLQALGVGNDDDT